MLLKYDRKPVHHLPEGGGFVEGAPVIPNIKREVTHWGG